MTLDEEKKIAWERDYGEKQEARRIKGEPQTGIY
jgi:hypothetical protein